MNTIRDAFTDNGIDSAISRHCLHYPDDGCYDIAFAFDDDYCKYYAAVLRSLIDNRDPSSKYRVTVLYTNVDDKNIERITAMQTEDVAVSFHDVSGFVKDAFESIEMNVRHYWKVETYYKCFIPLLMQCSKRVLFADADVIFCSDPKDIFSEDLGECQVVAVPDTSIPFMSTYSDGRGDRLESYGVDISRYFNAGLVLYENERIDPKEYYNLMIHALENYELPFQDQDVLNIIFSGKVRLVSCRYNYQRIVGPGYIKSLPDSSYKNDYVSAKRDPVMIHYIGKEKPWINRYYVQSDIFWRYLEKTDFLDDVKNTDYMKGLTLKQRFLRRSKRMLARVFSSDSKVFGLFEKLAR